MTRNNSTSNNCTKSYAERVQPLLSIIKADEKTIAANKEQSIANATKTNKALPSSASASSFKDCDLGTLRPEFYKAPAHVPHYGSICISLVYDGAVESLTVKIIKAKNLTPRISSKSNVSRNSFVRIFLLPDEKDFVQTKIRNKCNNPVFNEEFSFPIPSPIIRHKTLRLSIYDECKKKSSHVLLGHALINLSDVDLTIMNDEIWKDLDEAPRLGEIGSPHGCIRIGLSYTPSCGRFGVYVFEVQNLNLINLDISTGVYVKVELHLNTGAIKTKKTSTKFNAADHVFNETLSFEVDENQIEKAYLRAAVIASGNNGSIMQKLKSSVKGSLLQKKKSHRICGFVAFGSSDDRTKEESHHWREMFSNAGRPITKWLALREECD